MNYILYLQRKSDFNFRLRFDSKHDNALPVVPFPVGSFSKNVLEVGTGKRNLIEPDWVVF